MRRIAVLALCVWAAICFPVQAKDVRIAVEKLTAVPGNPYLASVADNIRPALFDGLTRFNKDGELVPALATRWSNDTPKRWRFVLRRDVMFSNGEPLSSAAVVSAITWLQTPDGKLTAVGSALPEMTAEADDDYAVIIETAKPDPLLPRRLANLMIVAPRAWAEVGPDAYAKTPATTGPFKIKSWDAAKAVLVANAGSWRKPKAERIAFTVIADSAARTKALAAGDVDVAAHLGPGDLNAIDRANLLTSVTPAMAVLAIAFRQEMGRDTPLRDSRVRRALNYAVDKGALSRTLLRGLGPAAGQPAARDVQGYDPQTKAFPFDPEKAKALLADAGFADGLTLHIAVNEGRYTGDGALYDALAASLAQVGVTLTVDKLGDDDWLQAFDNGAWADDVAGFSLAFTASPTNDVTTAMATWSCLKLVPFVCDQSLTQRITAARETMSADKRASMLADLAQTFHDDPPALYLVDAFDLTGVSRKVDGFAIADRVPVYENISVP